jgi:glucose/arabinose dehydrogenase
VGCSLVLVRFDEGGKVIGQEPFASGWLQGDKCLGRPNDVFQMPDGSLLVSDDKANVLYRISYKGQ